MNKNITTTLIVACLCAIQSSYGQNIERITTISSPNAASAAKLEEASVNLSAGTLNLGIPLYTLEESNLQLPVSLSYTNGNGVKPDEHPGWVGMGWNLNAGGSITRVVKGNAPDEFSQTLYYHLSSGGNNMFSQTIPIGYAYYTNILKQSNWNTTTFIANLLSDEYDSQHNVTFDIDTEPDVFYLSFPGFSGKMYVNQDSYIAPGDATKYFIKGIKVEGDPLMTVEAEVKGGFSWFFANDLIPTPNGAQIDAVIKATKSIITGFLVTTGTGVKYAFGSYGTSLVDPTKIEFSEDFHAQSLYSGFPNTWHLASIQTPNNEDNITFTYEKKDFTLALTHNFQFEKTTGQAPSGIFPFFNTTVGASSSSMTSKVGAGLAYPSYLKKISSNYYDIDFTTSVSNELKAAYSSLVNGTWPYIFYDGVFPISINGIPDQGQSSALNDPNFYFDADILVDSNTPDANNDNAPDNNLLLRSCDARDGLIDLSETGYIQLPNLNIIYQEKINENKLKWYKLDKITVKNKTSNTVLRSFTFNYDNTSTQRLRLYSITEKGENENSDVKPALTLGYDNTALPGYLSGQIDHWGYYNGNTSNVTVDPNNPNWATVNTNYLAKRAPNATYLQAGILKNINYPNGASVAFTYEIHKYKKVVKRNVTGGAFNLVTNASETDAGGVRVKTITTNPGSSQPSIAKTYTYTDGTLGGEYQYYWPAYKFKLISNPNATVTRERFITQTILPVTLNSTGNHIYYTNVTETLSGYGKTEYTFTDFATNPDDNFDASVNVDHSAYSAYSSRAMERGLLKSVKVYNSSNVLEKEDIYTYDRLNTNFVRAIENSLPKVLGGYERIGSAYKVHLYPYKQKSLTTKTYLAGSSNPVTVVQNYDYNSCALLASETMVNSDAKTYVTSYKYACDESVPPAPVYDDSQCLADYDACWLTCVNEPDPQVQAYCYQYCQNEYFNCQDQAYANWQAAYNAWLAQYGTQYANYMNFLEKNMLGTLLETKTTEGVNQIGTKTTYKKGWGTCTTCLYPEKFYELEGANNWVEQSKVTQYETASGLPQFLVKRYNDGTYSANYEFTWTNRRLTQKKFINRTWSYDYDFTKSRQLKKITDFDGQISNFGYDGFQRLDWSNGRNNNISSDFNYQVGTTNKLIQLDYFSDFSTQNTETKFDGLGREIEMKKIGYTYNNTDYISTMSYNARGWVLNDCEPSKGGCKTYNYYTSPLGRVRYEIPYGGGTAIWYYYETNAAGEVAGYNANTLFKTKVKDENGHFTSTYSDYLGRAVLVRREINSTTFSDTYYTYDIRGNITQVKTPNNLFYTFEYYPNGQLWKKTVPDAGTVTYTYDLRDRQIKMEDANGNIVENTLFDEYDQVKQVKQNNTVIKTYDYYTTNSANAADKGKLKSSVINALGTATNITTNYSYDLYGRLIRTTANNILNGQDTFDFTYNHLDKMLTKIRRHRTQVGLTTNLYNIAEKYDYDHGGRNIRNYFNLGLTPTQKISELAYNNNDWQVTRKVGHYVPNDSWLQQLDYTYTSRGWLNNINQFVTASTSIANCTPGPIVYPCNPPCAESIQMPEPEEVCLETVTNQVFTIDYNKEALSDPAAQARIAVKYEADFTYANGETKRKERNFVFSRNEYPALGTTDPVADKYTHTYIASLTAYKVNHANKDFAANEVMDDLKNNLKEIDIDESVLDWLVTSIEYTITPVYEECANCLQAPPPADIFAMQLNYTAGNSLLNAPAQANGNISNVIWQIHNREKQAYGFTYDALDRMTAAYYADIRNDGGYTTDNKFGENVTYLDYAGNIQNITRRGITSNGTNCYYFNTIDQLTLTTLANSNKLQSVVEASSTTKGYTSSGGSFTYDANGNVKTNTAKNITNITYNYLNLPTQITIGTTQRIDFLYDADGNKLRKQIYQKNGSLWGLVQERHYMQGIEYFRVAPNQSKVEAMYHQDGRLAFLSGGSTRYEYALKDHLGSMRLQFADLDNNGTIDGNTEILQEGQYYPFGMNLDCPVFNHPNATYTTDNYQFNYKELNTDYNLNWHDFGGRWYDGALGRWMSIDPMADAAEQLDKVPYAAFWNNPIRYDDPDGNCPRCLKTLAKTVVKSVAKGKLDLGDVYDLVDAGKTILDPSSSLLDKGLALFDVVSPVSTKELKAVGKVVGLVDDVKDATKAADKVNDTRKAVQKYEVGDFNDLQKRSKPGDGLDLHHVPQKKPASQVIKGYDGDKAPAVAIPQKQHKSIPTKKGNYSGTARDQLAKDAKDLRGAGVPNKTVQEVIDYNKRKYPDAYNKQ